MPVVRESADGSLFKERTFGENLVGDVLSGPIQLVTGGWIRAGTHANGVALGHITGGMGIVGVRDGVEQWRASSSSGDIVFGGGVGSLDSNGLSVYNSGSRLVAFMKQGESWWMGGYTGIADLSIMDDTSEGTGEIVLSLANKKLGAQKAYNGDFAAGYTGWTGVILLTGTTNQRPYVGAYGKSGSNGAVFYGEANVAGPDSLRWITNGPLSAAAGVSYELQFDVKITTPAYPHISAKIIWTNVGGGTIRTDTVWDLSNQNLFSPTSNSWRRVICRAGPAPADTTGVKIAFDATAPDISEVEVRGDTVLMIVDNVSFSEIVNMAEVSQSLASINLNGSQTRIEKGLIVGYGNGLTGSVGSGNIYYSGQIVPYRNNTEYAGTVFVPLASALTSTSWDGDSYSTTSKTLIDMSSVFSAPAGVKAFLMYVQIRDSGSSSGNAWIILSPNNTAGSGPALHCAGLTNDAYSSGQMIVSCDANGDIYYQTLATGTNTLDVILRVLGYWL